MWISRGKCFSRGYRISPLHGSACRWGPAARAREGVERPAGRGAGSLQRARSDPAAGGSERSSASGCWGAGRGVCAWKSAVNWCGELGLVCRYGYSCGGVGLLPLGALVRVLGVGDLRGGRVPGCLCAGALLVRVSRRREVRLWSGAVRSGGRGMTESGCGRTYDRRCDRSCALGSGPRRREAERGKPCSSIFLVVGKPRRRSLPDIGPKVTARRGFLLLGTQCGNTACT